MVRKRGDAWFTDVVYHYVDVAGVRRQKRVRKKIGTKKQDAIAAEAQIRAQIAAGTFDPDPPVLAAGAVLFSDFCRLEFAPWSQMQHSPKHHDEQLRMLESKMIPFFKGLYLHEITTKRIEDYKQGRKGERYTRRGWKTAKKTKAATVNRELACIKGVFRQAVAWGRLEVSPAAGVSSLREPPNPPRLLSSDEIYRLLDEAPDHMRALVGCAVYAGLRKSEITRLHWGDIDFKSGVLVVKSREGATTKNYRERKIPLSSELARLLQQHPHRLGSDYVFAGKFGGQLKELRAVLTKAARAAGIDDLGLHQLRHAFCSHALMSGVDPRTVQLWMGHRDLRTTLGYAHTSPQHERAAIQLVRYRAENEAEKGVL